MLDLKDIDDFRKFLASVLVKASKNVKPDIGTVGNPVVRKTGIQEHEASFWYEHLAKYVIVSAKFHKD